MNQCQPTTPAGQTIRACPTIQALLRSLGSFSAEEKEILETAGFAFKNRYACYAKRPSHFNAGTEVFPVIRHTLTHHIY